MTRHYSYSSLLRQRTVVAGLTLGLVTVMTGMAIELSLTAQRTTIAPSVKRLIEPLDPLLDIKTVERLEGYQSVPLETAKAFVQDVLNRPEAEIVPIIPDAPIQIGEVAPIIPDEPVEAGTQAPAAEALEPEQLFPAAEPEQTPTTE